MLTPSLLHLDAGRLVPAPPERPERLQAAIDHLFDRINYERLTPGKYELGDFQLSRMESLLKALDDPHLATPCVHIAGTKGKGSTASMTAAILQAAGYRTGLFTSPHIHYFEERIRVDRTWVSPQDMLASFEAVWSAVEQLDAAGLYATYFEITTALAWDVFRRVGCDLAVIEVGLGGRLDSTNLCRPLVTAITSISRDHSKLLGDTPLRIAAEKAGIFKPGVPAVSGVERNTASTIRAIADDVGCSLWQLGREISFESADTHNLLPHPLNVTTPAGDHRDLLVTLPGQHQSRNAALATAICDLLPEEFPVDEAAIRAGLAEATCPLRVEVIASEPTIVLDGAHNGASIAALMETLLPIKCRKRWLIIGAGSDKHVDDMLAEIGRTGGDSAFAEQVIVAAYQSNPRAMPAEQMAGLVADGLGVKPLVAESPAHAIKHVLSIASEDDLIIVTGSFFLAAEIREYFIAIASEQQAAAAGESTDSASSKSVLQSKTGMTS